MKIENTKKRIKETGEHQKTTNDWKQVPRQQEHRMIEERDIKRQENIKKLQMIGSKFHEDCENTERLKKRIKVIGEHKKTTNDSKQVPRRLQKHRKIEERE
ncbi:unnamed protein product [Gordionus sp. m RMFG-2023]